MYRIDGLNELKMAQTNLQKAAAYQIATLAFLYRHKYSNLFVINKLYEYLNSIKTEEKVEYSDINSHQRLRNYEQKKLIKKVPIYVGNVSNVYILTKSGRQALGLACSYRDFNRPIIKPSNINPMYANHSLCIQMGVLMEVRRHLLKQLENKIGSVDFDNFSYRTEREFDSSMLLKGHKRPDAIIEVGDERIAIEAEISPKSDREMAGYIGMHERMLTKKLYHSVYYYFTDPFRLKNYKDIIESGAFDVYEKNEKGQYHISNEAGKIADKDKYVLAQNLQMKILIGANDDSTKKYLAGKKSEEAASKEQRKIAKEAKE